ARPETSRSTLAKDKAIVSALPRLPRVARPWVCSSQRASRNPSPHPLPEAERGEQNLSFSPSPLRGGGGGRGCSTAAEGDTPSLAYSTFRGEKIAPPVRKMP